MTPPRLRHSIVALGAVQVASFAIPLVALPYLTRVLGAEVYGKVAFVQALVAYLVMGVEYGFAWSATRSIAVARDDAQAVSRLFAATWAAQWLLAGAAAVLLAALIATVPALRADAMLYLCGYLAVIASLMFPLWLLQGLERMREMAIVSVAGRLLVLPLLLWWVDGPQDGALVLLLMALGPMLSGLVSLGWIVATGLVAPQWPTLAMTLGALRDGRVLFMSRVSISLYTMIAPLVVGALAGPAALAYFTLADKVRRAAQAALQPIGQALFPRFSNLFENDAAQARALLRRSTWLTLGLALPLSAALWIGAERIVAMLGGPGFADAVPLLELLAPLPALIALSNLYGVQVLVPLGHTVTFNRVLAGAAAIGGLAIVVMVWAVGMAGAAWALLFTEAAVTACMVGCASRTGFRRAQPA